MEEKNLNPQIDRSRVIVNNVGKQIGVFIGLIQDNGQVRVLGCGANELRGAINELESTVLLSKQLCSRRKRWLVST